MIKKITTYPAQTGFGFGGTVRHFDESLFSLIDDLKETIEENDLDGLAAFQINSPLNVIVVRYEDTYLEIINPAIFTKEGELTPTESTAYYPNLTAVTKRAKMIKVMYEDRSGAQQFLTAEDDLAVLIQRKNDYLLGSTFIARLSEEEKERFEAKLGGNAIPEESKLSCPTTLKSEKILMAIKYILSFGLIGAIVGYFLSASLQESLKSLELSLMVLTGILILSYFFYAKYEGKKYSNCTSCQISNIMALSLIKTIHLAGLGLLSYLLLW